MRYDGRFGTQSRIDLDNEKDSQTPQRLQEQPLPELGPDEDVFFQKGQPSRRTCGGCRGCGIGCVFELDL